MSSIGRPDIVLCYPLFDKVFFTEPVGICMLAAYLCRDGFEALVDDGYLRGESVGSVAGRIARMNPLAVGISMNAEREVPDGMLLAENLQRNGFQGLIVAGGAFAAMSRNELLLSGLVHCVVIGDGEEVTADLLRRCAQGLSPAGLDGLVFSDGSWVPRVGIGDLDALPPMDRSVFRRMIAANGNTISGIQATISTGRGCFANCAFCSIQSFARMNSGIRYRQRGLHSVVSEMESLHSDFGIRDFYFCTGQFFPPGVRRARERAAQLRDAVAQLSFRPSIFLYMRCDNVDEEVVHLLREAGVTTLFLGVESFDDRVLGHLEKGLSSDQIIAALSELERQGYGSDYRTPLRLKLGFIMFTPWTDLDGLDRNSRYCRRFRIPPKKMLYSLQLHPENRLSGNWQVVERDSVHFVDLQGAIGEVYRAYSSFFRTVFTPLERMRAYQKASVALPQNLLEVTWLVVDRLNEIAWNSFDAILEGARSERASEMGEVGQEQVAELLRQVSFERLLGSLAMAAGRTACVESHFNRGYDNPQVLDPRSAETGLRYP